MNYSVRRRKGLRIAILVALVALLAALGTAAFVVRGAYSRNIQPRSDSQQEILYVVEPGATAHDIALGLESKGIIKASWAFEWYVRSHNERENLQAGSYYLKPSQSVADIVSVITRGKVATDLVTILPAQRLDEVQAALVKSGFSEASVKAALDPAKYTNHPALSDKPEGATLEGYLYPDSFQKTAETTPEDVIKLSLDEMQQHLTPDVRAGFVKQGLTVHQGVTLASIVEKETGAAADRPTVAQVFLRRLSIGMELGSDVTAFYGAEVAGQTPSVAYDTPYNTRIHTGLPPGPISNVTESSLSAVAHPATTDFLFFVAGDDGTTHFAHTVEEHDANVAQYCTKLCQ